jgi:hypothetical protein
MRSMLKAGELRKTRDDIEKKMEADQVSALTTAPPRERCVLSRVRRSNRRRVASMRCGRDGWPMPMDSEPRKMRTISVHHSSARGVEQVELRELYDGVRKQAAEGKKVGSFLALLPRELYLIVRQTIPPPPSGVVVIEPCGGAAGGNAAVLELVRGRASG